MDGPQPNNEMNVLAHLKQRHPLLMVDKILTVHKGVEIRTAKNITANEIHAQGGLSLPFSFPSTLIIECFAQSAAILIRMEDGEAPDVFDVIGSVLRFEFLKPLFPGDRVEVCMKILKVVEGSRIIGGEGFVDNKLVATGKFIFGKLNLSEISGKE